MEMDHSNASQTMQALEAAMSLVEAQAAIQDDGPYQQQQLQSGSSEQQQHLEHQQLVDHLPPVYSPTLPSSSSTQTRNLFPIQNWPILPTPLSSSLNPTVSILSSDPAAQKECTTITLPPGADIHLPPPLGWYDPALPGSIPTSLPVGHPWNYRSTDLQDHQRLEQGQEQNQEQAKPDLCPIRQPNFPSYPWTERIGMDALEGWLKDRAMEFAYFKHGDRKGKAAKGKEDTPDPDQTMDSIDDSPSSPPEDLSRHWVGPFVPDPLNPNGISVITGSKRRVPHSNYSQIVEYRCCWAGKKRNRTVPNKSGKKRARAPGIKVGCKAKLVTKRIDGTDEVDVTYHFYHEGHDPTDIEDIRKVRRAGLHPEVQAFIYGNSDFDPEGEDGDGLEAGAMMGGGGAGTGKAGTSKRGKKRAGAAFSVGEGPVNAGSTGFTADGDDARKRRRTGSGINDSQDQAQQSLLQLSTGSIEDQYRPLDNFAYDQISATDAMAGQGAEAATSIGWDRAPHAGPSEEQMRQEAADLAYQNDTFIENQLAASGGNNGAIAVRSTEDDQNDALVGLTTLGRLPIERMMSDVRSESNFGPNSYDNLYAQHSHPAAAANATNSNNNNASTGTGTSIAPEINIPSPTRLLSSLRTVHSEIGSHISDMQGFDRDGQLKIVSLDQGKLTNWLQDGRRLSENLGTINEEGRSKREERRLLLEREREREREVERERS